MFAMLKKKERPAEPRPAAAPPNRTGIPAQLKRQIEAASKLSLDDVRIHYSSAKPAELGAQAYTQGAQVYLGPGQQRHLGHELGHVIQQKQGRVPTEVTLGAHSLNLNPALEQEADRLAGSFSAGFFQDREESVPLSAGVVSDNAPVQMRVTMNYDEYYQNIVDLPAAPPVSRRKAIKYLEFSGIRKEFEFLNRLYPENIASLREDYNSIKKSLHPLNGANFLQAVNDFITHSNELYDGEDLSETLKNQQYTAADTTDLKPTRLALHDLAHPAAPKTQAPLNSASSRIPILPFTQAQAHMPRGLTNLLRDIYSAWIRNGTFDTRSETERTARSTTPSAPGSLRSYHMNVLGSLPSPIDSSHHRPALIACKKYMSDIRNTHVTAAFVGGRGSGMHDDYKDHSKMEAAASIVQADQTPHGTDAQLLASRHPVGYAEYTGIAFGGEPHECKIVFNYTNGDMYLTLTHYQYYSITGVHDGREFSGLDQTPVQEKFSPWFKINMKA